MSTTAGAGVEVVAADTPALGDRSYLAHDGQVALLVDPQREVDRMLDLAAARGVRITPFPRPICTGESPRAVRHWRALPECSRSGDCRYP